MIKRTLYFGNPAYLNLANAQLKVRIPEIEKSNVLDEHFRKESEITIPVEDIGIIVLDNKQITLTQGLIEALLDNNVAIISCDKTHHPLGLMLPLYSNTIQNERYRAQLSATEPLKKQLWQQTITQKIKNQSAHLAQHKLNNAYLLPLFKNVKSGDSENAEGIAAAFYWKTLSTALMHPEGEFKRSREGDPPNNLLNYGYAILRATMARSIVGAGLLPTLGIHHQNRYNAYCLADDLMEPYRPLVDLVVCNILRRPELGIELNKETKTILLGIPAMDVLINDEKSPLMLATQRTAVSLVKCFEGDQKKLVYPDFNA